MLAQTPPPSLSQFDANRSYPSTASMLSCSLVWSARQLFVKAQPEEESFELSDRCDRDWLVECLKRSPVEVIKLDHQLNTDLTLWWIQACDIANKPCYLDLDIVLDQSSKITEQDRSNHLQGITPLILACLNRVSAMLLLLLHLPLMLMGFLMFALQLKSISRKKCWVIGEKGRIFQLLEWRETQQDQVKTSGWMLEVIQNIHNLIHVLRGDLNLFGRPPLRIDEEVQQSWLNVNFQVKPGAFSWI